MQVVTAPSYIHDKECTRVQLIGGKDGGTSMYQCATCLSTFGTPKQYQEHIETDCFPEPDSSEAEYKVLVSASELDEIYKKLADLTDFIDMLSDRSSSDDV